MIRLSWAVGREFFFSFLFKLMFSVFEIFLVTLNDSFKQCVSVITYQDKQNEWLVKSNRWKILYWRRQHFNLMSIFWGEFNWHHIKKKTQLIWKNHILFQRRVRRVSSAHFQTLLKKISQSQLVIIVMFNLVSITVRVNGTVQFVFFLVMKLNITIVTSCVVIRLL